MNLSFPDTVSIGMTVFILSVFLLALGAAFAQRTTGFGFGITIMTALPFVMPSYGEATMLSGLLSLTSAGWIACRMRRFLKLKKLLPMLFSSLLVSTACIFLVSRMHNALLLQVLGIMLILISIYFIFFSKRIHMPATRSWQIGAGTLSGTMGGFFGMQGPPAVLYFISSAPDKNEYMSLMQTYVFLSNIGMTLVRAWNGFVSAEVGFGYLVGFAGVLAGTALGTWVYDRIPNRLFRYAVYGYIAVSGVIIFLTA